MTTIYIPQTIEEAVAELDGLAELLTATEWHRAAIIAAHVRLDEGHGGRETSTSGRFLSARRFADLGIRGLKSATTVAHYVQCWLDGNGGNYPPRGTKIVLPHKPWPPQERNAGTRTTTSSIGRQIKNDPQLAAAAVEALLDGGIDGIEPELNVKLSKATERKLVEDYGPATPTPMPTPRRKDDDEPDDAYWKRARWALATLVDVKVKIDAGATPPPDIAILMEILVPETDWDQAARDLIADLS